MLLTLRVYFFVEKAVKNKKIKFYTRDVWLELYKVLVCVINMFKVKKKNIALEVPLVTSNANVGKSPHIILVLWLLQLYECLDTIPATPYNLDVDSVDTKPTHCRIGNTKWNKKSNNWAYIGITCYLALRKSLKFVPKC